MNKKYKLLSLSFQQYIHPDLRNGLAWNNETKTKNKLSSADESIDKNIYFKTKDGQS